QGFSPHQPALGAHSPGRGGAARSGGFPDRLSRYAERTLARMGVDVLLNTPISAVDARGVTAKGEHFEAATVIWCAGVEATPVAPWLGLAPGKGGTVAVAPNLSLP